MIFNRYNELDYAKKIHENGFLTRFRKYELKILGKYLRDSGLSMEEVKNEIILFCVKHITEFNDVVYYKMINNIMNYVKKKKNKLMIIDDLIVYDFEVNSIKEMDISYEAKTFLFCLLVKFRLNKEIYLFNNDDENKSLYFSNEEKKQKEVFKMTAFTKKEANMNELIKELYDNEAIYIADNGKIKLSFLESLKDECKNEDSFVKIDIKHLDVCGYFWDMLNSDKRVKLCKICGVLIKGKGKANNLKYCKPCSKEKLLVYNRIKQSEYRKAKNV